MNILMAKITALREDEQKSEMEKFYGDKGSISWGNQIRSYVFQPYRMVKDLRTNVQASDVQGVMDGELDPFVNGWLRAGVQPRKPAAPKTRGIATSEIRRNHLKRIRKVFLQLVGKFMSERMVPMIPQIKPPFVFPLPLGSIFPRSFYACLSNGNRLKARAGTVTSDRNTSPPIPRPIPRVILTSCSSTHLNTDRKGR